MVQKLAYRIPLIDKVSYGLALVLLDGALNHWRHGRPCTANVVLVMGVYALVRLYQPNRPSPIAMGTAPAATRFSGDRDAEILTVYRNQCQSSWVTSYRMNGCGVAEDGGASSRKPLSRVAPLQNKVIGSNGTYGKPGGGCLLKQGGGGSSSFSTLWPGAIFPSADVVGTGDAVDDGGAKFALRTVRLGGLKEKVSPYELRVTHEGGSLTLRQSG